jgi:electron transfer flavoprotein beta subunit
MNIIVCVKPILVASDADISTRNGMEQVINPLDIHAVEEGVRLKEKYGGAVYIVSMGTLLVENLLRDMLSYGADGAYLLSDKSFAGSDTLATSYVLACGIRKICNPDIIIMGNQSADSETGQVGPEVAEHLDVPHITAIRKIVKVDKQNYWYLERQLENGYMQVKIRSPLLITVLKDINHLRIPTLKDRIASKNAAVKIWDAEHLNVDIKGVGINGSATQVVQLSAFANVRNSCVFADNVEKSVSMLLEKFPDLTVKKKFV